VLKRSQRAVYDAAKENISGRKNEGTYFIGDIFDAIDEPISIAWMHIGPNGNSIVAGKIFEVLNTQ